MKTHFVLCILAISLLAGIPVTSMAQGTFDAKKKTGTMNPKPSPDATRIDGPHSSLKSTRALPSAGSQLQTILGRNAHVPLEPPDKSTKRIVHSTETGLPVFIQTTPATEVKTKSTLKQTVSERCYAYLNELKPLLRMHAPEEQFAIRNISSDRFAKTHIRLDQVYKGVPVYGADVVVHLDEQGSGELFNGRYVKVPDGIATTPVISPADAIEKAGLHLNRGNEKPVPLPAFSIVADRLKPEATLTLFHKKGLFPAFRLAYHVVLFSRDHHRWEYFVDASGGDIIHYFENTCHVDGPKTASAKDLNNVTRTINTYQLGSYYYLLDASRPMYSAMQSNLPDQPAGGILTIDMDNTYGENQSFQHVINTNNSWNNPTAVSAHYNAGVAYEYYRQQFGRNSIDGNGGTIISIINVPDMETGEDLDNAFWNGRFMCYGNGDVAFKPLAGGLDVAGHEMTHGVIENTANLEYDGESGAINESFADIFGSMMDDEDWLIGEDVVLTQAFPSGALRSMSDPHNGGSDLNDRGYQPGHMNEKYTGSQDNNGVHINSGIPNNVFYRLATAIGREKAAAIYYKALTDYLTKSSRFIDLRLAVIQSATDIHGAGSDEVTQAGIAFDAVGITDGNGNEVITTLPENPGEEYLLLMNTDPGEYTLYRSDMDLNFEPLSATPLASRPSVQDNGLEAVFVAGDSTLHSIIVSPAYQTEETTIQDEHIWGNVVLSKDGNRVGAVTAYADTTIWVYDYVSERWAYFTLYNPTYLEGLTAAGVIYADALEFDVSGEFLVYDAYNILRNSDGTDIEYWDVNFIRVWDKAANDFGDGTIYKLFSSIPEGVSIGNPSFSKNSPQVLAFDYFDVEEDVYAVLGCNIETNEVITIVENNDLGWPSFNKYDSRVAFTSAWGVDNYSVNYVNIDINDEGGISTDGSTNNMFTGGAWSVYFATGVRNALPEVISGDPEQAIKSYPNPFTGFVTLEIPRELSDRCTLEILNVSGQIVYTDYYPRVEGDILILDLKDLPPGTYVVRLGNEKGVGSGRLLRY